MRKTGRWVGWCGFLGLLALLSSGAIVCAFQYYLPPLTDRLRSADLVVVGHVTDVNPRAYSLVGYSDWDAPAEAHSYGYGSAKLLIDEVLKGAAPDEKTIEILFDSEPRTVEDDVAGLPRTGQTAVWLLSRQASGPQGLRYHLGQWANAVAIESLPDVRQVLKNAEAEASAWGPARPRVPSALERQLKATSMVVIGTLKDLRHQAPNVPTLPEYEWSFGTARLDIDEVLVADGKPTTSVDVLFQYGAKPQVVFQDGQHGIWLLSPPLSSKPVTAPQGAYEISPRSYLPMETLDEVRKSSTALAAAPQHEDTTPLADRLKQAPLIVTGMLKDVRPHAHELTNGRPESSQYFQRWSFGEARLEIGEVLKGRLGDMREPRVLFDDYRSIPTSREGQQAICLLTPGPHDQLGHIGGEDDYYTVTSPLPIGLVDHVRKILDGDEGLVAEP